MINKRILMSKDIALKKGKCEVKDIQKILNK